MAHNHRWHLPYVGSNPTSASMDHQWELKQKALVNEMWICTRCGLKVFLKPGERFSWLRLQHWNWLNWSSKRRVTSCKSSDGFPLCITEDDVLCKDIIE